MSMDPRLRAAVDASAQWYDDVFAALAIPATRGEQLWVAGAEPPRWHSAVKTLCPDVSTATVIEAMSPFVHGTVADSFGDQDLHDDGFELLIDASWLHLAAPEPARAPGGWHVVADRTGRGAWNTAHGTDVPEHLRITLLGRYDDHRLVAGAALNDADASCGISNTWGAEWPDVVRVAASLRPGADLTAYAHGADRDAAVEAGFSPVGPQRVWIR
jgi:hypothetical protein